MTTEQDRETLEQQARLAICACYAYDLDPEAMTDTDLRAIIADPQWAHKQAQHYDPLPEAEYAATLAQCPQNNQEATA